MNRQFLIYIVIIWVSINSACFVYSQQKNEPAAADVVFSLPKATGAYGVGRQLIYLSDETRKQSEKSRQIAVWIYYPAEPLKRGADEPVLPSKWAESYRTIQEKRLGRSAAAALLAAKTAAESAAPAGSSKQSFPVLIFAPGANWLPTDYSATIEDLASHGYIVIAFASAPLSPVIQFSDGTMFESPRVDESTYAVVSEDFRFVVGQLERLEQDASLPIKGRFDLSRIGTFGHSIGGAAAIRAATNHPKIVAAINLDGDFSGETASAAPTQPILYITTEPPNLSGAPIEKWDEDRSEIRRKGVWERVQANSKNAVRVRAAKMFHTNFQDAALLPADSVPANLRANRFGTIEGARGVRLAADLVRRFFDAQLKNAPFENFLRLERDYPEIKIQTKPE